MGKRISVQTKIKRGYGTGVGADYQPWYHIGEFNSKGTTSAIRDWKTGREVHCLSQGEAYWYYILRWNDKNLDIREQFPLDPVITRQIAENNGFYHPPDNEHRLTTDFLVTESSGVFHAYSVKPNRDLKDKTWQVLCVEKLYWLNRGCKFDMLFKTDVNVLFANNIRTVVAYYDPTSVFDKYSAIKHKIATKEWAVDMESSPLTTKTYDWLLEKNS